MDDSMTDMSVACFCGSGKKFKFCCHIEEIAIKVKNAGGHFINPSGTWEG